MKKQWILIIALYLCAFAIGHILGVYRSQQHAEAFADEVADQVVASVVDWPAAIPGEITVVEGTNTTKFAYDPESRSVAFEANGRRFSIPEDTLLILLYGSDDAVRTTLSAAPWSFGPADVEQFLESRRKP